MASSLNDSFLDELTCPICFEDFKEPKCLPNCAHNICKNCLEILVARMDKEERHIECPICREKVRVPRKGVSAMPTNTLINRLLERAPAKKAQGEILRALEKSKAAKETLQKSYEAARSSVVDFEARSGALKRVITEKATSIRNLIKSQETLLISKVNEQIKKHSANSDLVQKTKSSLEKLELSIKKAQAILNESDADKTVKFKETLVRDLEESCRVEMLSARTQRFDLEFFPNVNLEERLKEERFGKIVRKSEGDSPQTKQQCGVKIVKTVTAEDIGETSFSPYTRTIAVSLDKGEMAVLDDEANRVHILTDRGNHLRSFGVKFGDLYDVAFVDYKFLDGIIVVNRSHNRLLAYQRLTGKFYPLFFSSEHMQSTFMKISLSSVSTTPDGRLIVTSEGLDDSCVVVVDANFVNELVFGKGRLLCPRKAIFYNNEFYICDRDDGNVKVFDASGGFRREIGEELESPRGIAIDEKNGNVLIADPGTDCIHVFKAGDGSFVGKLDLDGSPVSIAFNGDGNLVVCYHDESPCLQILSYTI